MSAELEELIHGLSDPSIYPHKPPIVEVVQTHISAVFLAGDLVYKVKKPVDLGFLDFSTLEKRKHFCQQEVILNSRFSHGIYLGVLPIFRGAGGFNLDGTGMEVDAAVLMRRVPQDCFMHSMLQQDKITPEIMDRLADRLAYFHSLAARGPEIAAYGAAEVIHGNLMENFAQTAAYVDRTLDRETYEQLRAGAIDFLFLNDTLFRNRARGGFIRDCHGDLHLDHVLILDGIMFYDCIEFNDRFRYGDTASDLGFLLMDLDYWGFPAYGERITQRYVEYSGDRDVLDLLNFYKSYRAFVRGKVSSMALDESEIGPAEKAILERQARDHFDLALQYFEGPCPPVLIITSGLSGTGKSFISTLLGKRLGADVLRSDVIRKRLHGIPEFEHRLDKFGSGVYTPKATEQTYAALMEEAREALAQGRSVVLDASFMRYADRRSAREVAWKAGARFRVIECTASDHEVRSRLEKRQARQDEPSDGRWEIYCKQKSVVEPIRLDEHRDWRVWDSLEDVNTFLGSFVRELVCSRRD